MTDDQLVPISLVAQHAFCPRRAWLEAMGEESDSFQIASGIDAHRASDRPEASRPERRRAVEIQSVEIGVSGRCDLIEVNDRVTVVEFKSTPIRRKPAVTYPMTVQLALQAVALRASGVHVEDAEIYFLDHSIRIPVPLDDQTVNAAVAELHLLRSMLARGIAPAPLVDDPRCRSCSHIDVCLPDERRYKRVRSRIHVANPDAEVLHIATPGARCAMRTGRMIVVRGEEDLGSYPIERVHSLVVHGNVDLSGALIRELLWRRVPIVWCSSRGRVVGWATSAQSPNGLPRHRQHVHSAQGNIQIAREIVRAKIANQATLVRRHGSSEVAQVLRNLQRSVAGAETIPQLFGIEGDAAARYFDSFVEMLSSETRPWASVGGRSRRPALDPLNACLNMVYGLLVADMIRAIAACGLDPHVGFLHSSNRNKPALALDLMEEFRAPVADSVVIGAINNREIRLESFSTVTGVPRLRDAGRKSLIAAYERRVKTEFRHPLFGYSVTWRRAMEIQARLILGVVDGTQSAYRGITTR